jgi:TDG/mug DNA glycosylase family protein
MNHPTSRPTRTDLLAAEGRQVPDVIAPGLAVLFCGINPGLWSAAVGHHFAHPSNRFWKVLHGAGFTDRLLAPAGERELLARGAGITNLVERATRTANDLGTDELRHGARVLEDKVAAYRPRFVAVVGVQAYRMAFRRPRAGVGPQPEALGPSRLWVLPNPSGAQAHYQQADLVQAFAELRRAAQSRSRYPGSGS